MPREGLSPKQPAPLATLGRMVGRGLAADWGKRVGEHKQEHRPLRSAGGEEIRGTLQGLCGGEGDWGWKKGKGVSSLEGRIQNYRKAPEMGTRGNRNSPSYERRKPLGLGKRALEAAEQWSWESTLEGECGDWKNRWNSQGRGEGESPGHRVCLGEEGAGLSRGQAGEAGREERLGWKRGRSRAGVCPG